MPEDMHQQLDNFRMLRRLIKIFNEPDPNNRWKLKGASTIKQKFLIQKGLYTTVANNNVKQMAGGNRRAETSHFFKVILPSTVQEKKL
ncbi:hypothetical protein CISIN_1g0434991mg, partial [Citrus sinensis]